MTISVELSNINLWKPSVLRTVHDKRAVELLGASSGSGFLSREKCRPAAHRRFLSCRRVQVLKGWQWLRLLSDFLVFLSQVAFKIAWVENWNTCLISHYLSLHEVTRGSVVCICSCYKLNEFGVGGDVKAAKTVLLSHCKPNIPCCCRSTLKALTC